MIGNILKYWSQGWLRELCADKYAQYASYMHDATMTNTTDRVQGGGTNQSTRRSGVPI